jgi:O-antigen/teichoic acid export membrane protein
VAAAALRTVGGYATLVVGSAGGRLLSFVAGVLVARLLGPSEFGDFTIFFALMVVVAALGDFIDITYVRHVNAPRAPDSAVYLRAALTLRLGLFAFLAALSVPLGLLLADAMFGRPELRLAAIAAVLTGASLGLVQLLASTFLARRRLALYSGVATTFYAAVLLVLVAASLASDDLSARTVYLLFVVTSLAVAGAACTVLVRRARPLRVERDAVAEIVRFARWLFAAGLVQAVYQRLDVVLLARYVDIEEVGQYGAALRYAMIGSMMLAAMMGFLLPRAARTRESRSAFSAYMREALLLAGLLVAGLALLLAASPLLVELLFGAAYAPAAPIARILLLGTMLAVLSMPFGQLLLAEDEPRGILHMGVLRLVAIAALVVALVPRIGAEGAAWATVAAEGAALAYALAAFLRRWPQRLREMPAEG